MVLGQPSFTSVSKLNKLVMSSYTYSEGTGRSTVTTKRMQGCSLVTTFFNVEMLKLHFVKITVKSILS